mmetsp:Transcript_33590/g.78111  ORF Transcript_33590/g.78111 Transcript_33590/m.78111 type:complete len:299 (-) Transcript_33590:255-1151(-)|eukprot:CAMPEP_0171100674 /NCGR_PEP_ID=MMETSP0766_2-20121228/53096_1 /TAXON_ID=439317 /ORGANISM="Gambierdiscus australes, Strain CAWD 149" /LENGTH=298 /DNA_ID=CAMNT_0011560543 /DNA_START=83 /DNA_END=979 /DNA_ORIENTATION=+
MLSGNFTEPTKDAKRRSKKGLGRKFRSARKALEACDDKAWLASVAPPAPVDVAAFLESFGYAAADAQTWEDLPQDEVPEGLARSGPWLGLGIAEHQEAGGHTWYQLECSLGMQGSKTVQWQVGRRLQHLREMWYDRVKSELGKSYKQHFDDVHFAHRGGRRGTSVRLHTWCCRLAARVNAGQLSPSIVALTLRFLEAPDATRQEELQRTATGCLLPSQRPVVEATRCSRAAGEESVSSSRSTRCEFSDNDNVLVAFSGSEGSDRSEAEAEEEEEEEEEYESDFETDSETSCESEDDKE